jgi:hypothetical protein
MMGGDLLYFVEFPAKRRDCTRSSPVRQQNGSGKLEMDHAAFRTFPDLMAWTDTSIRRGPLGVITLTFWRFGKKRRLVTRWEWLICLPALGPLPVTAQRKDMKETPS